MRKLLIAFSILALGVLGWSNGGFAQLPSAPIPAAPIPPAPVVTLYELSEKIQVDRANNMVFRESPLMGFAAAGTALCPLTLVTNPTAQTCTVTGLGRDAISLATGRGSVFGTFAVVVNSPLNGPVHVPDVPTLTGTFTGVIDLSLTILPVPIPLGFVTGGTFTIDQTGQALPFSATVRVPFVLTPGGPALYLADDRTTPFAARPVDQAIGFPLVRLEIRF